MCGIVASVDWGGACHRDAVERGLHALRHRGPDASRIWQSAGNLACLGHARLSVMDLPGGAQPFANEAGDIHVVANGEFYDFEQIREQLESRGHRFTTRCDTEILVHLYEEFGAGCLSYLRGEFAFVLWDARARSLLAARDRFGIKPLFYAELPGRLLFASEVKALHAAGVAAAWDEQGFYEKLVVDCPLEGRTLFRQVCDLPAAHYLVARESGLSLHRYWDWNYPREDDLPAGYSDDDYAHLLRVILEASVKLRLRADVPVACCLSSGIDSASVLGLMTHHSHRPVEAFCLAFEDPAYDESPQARETASHLQARFTPVPVTQAALAANFPAAVRHGETLFANAQVVAKFLLSGAVSRAGYKVALTGEGADEILAGYSFFTVDALRHGNAAVPRGIHNGAPAEPAEPDAPSAHAAPPGCLSRHLGYVPAWFESRDAFLAPLHRLFPAGLHEDRIHRRLLEAVPLEHQLHHRGVLNQSLCLFGKTSLPGHILSVMGDRMEMAHSVEGRLPFLDTDVVEFSRHLPPSQKVRGGVEKFVLRNAMRRLLPPAACGRRKRPILAPPALLAPGPLLDLMQDTLRGSALASIPFLSRSAALQLLDRALLAGAPDRAQLESPLMMLVSAAELAAQFRL